MKKFIALFVFISSISSAATVKIAVIDTGFSIKYKNQIRLCKTGHKSFVDDDPLTDSNGHGTHIAGLIAKSIKVDHCIMILKYYSPHSIGANNLDNSNKAFRWAIDQGVDMINYSGGGIKPSVTERALVEELLDKGIVLVTAAGNEKKDFKHQGYYPAMYNKDIIVVGNLMKKNGKVVRAPTSNYGEQVDIQVLGTNIRSLNGVLSGTSQSTAIVAGRIAKDVRSYRATEAVRKFNNQGRDNYHSPLYEYMRK